MNIQINPISPQKSDHFFAPFAKVLQSARISDTVVRVGFAYATLGGVQQLLSDINPIGNWSCVQKEFLIGINQAITEPAALETLRNIKGAHVRVFVPRKRLGIDALYSQPLFHAKVLAISGIKGRSIQFLQAGSANMTSAAISDNPKNFELSLAIQATDTESIDSKKFTKWWLDIWNQSIVVDRKFVVKYADLRKFFLDRNPFLQSMTEAPKSISKANNFFAEVGAGSGPPGQRHQIEFPEALARFFGRAQRRRRDITFRRGEKIWSGRPLSYKLTTFGVGIWRLGMPTQHTGGEPIAERAIRFRRTSESGTFEFEVADVNSEEFNSWVRLANLDGHLGATHGLRARRYGFY
jgi:hypothetical protein